MSEKMLPEFIRRDVERAIEAASHPKGMNVHDGKALIAADRLQYMLNFIDALRAHENESEAGAEPIYQVYEGPTQTWMDATLNYYNSATADGSRCRIVYLTPLSAKAIETAAIMKCAEVCERVTGYGAEACHDTLLALIPQDGKTALEEFGMKVAEEVRLQMFSRYQDDKDPYISMEALVSIVTNLIGVPPLNSGTVSGEE